MKTVLIIALILLVVGALLVRFGWAFLNPADMNITKDVVEVYHVSEAPTDIYIDAAVGSVKLIPIEGEEWRVECIDQEKLYHTIELADGTLTVKEVDKRAWYDHIGILSSLRNVGVTVYLPQKTYESLTLHSTSGGIRVERGLTFSNAELKNASGSIKFASSVTGSLDVKNTSGSVFVDGEVEGDLTVKNTSGSIHVIGGVGGALEIACSSGRIEIANATPTRATVKNTSGGIYLENVVCKESCTVENTSGGIELQRCDAMTFDVTTVSGGIRASILTAKSFDCRSTSGSVKVPNDGNGGMFKARSTSGSIKITIVE